MGGDAGRDALPPVGVLLFNLGGPPDLDAVEPFLVNLFSDRDIIQLPLGRFGQSLLARLIAKARGPSVRRNYALIGGGSPQLALTRAQAGALEAHLGRRGGRFRTFIAMRYWHPTTEEALLAMDGEGIGRVVTLTLYPHYSRATTGSSQRELDRRLAEPRWRGRFRVSGVASYAEDPTYLEALTATVREGFETFPPEARGRVVILFSAHGLPRKTVEAGDPYVRETEATRRGLVERLALPNRHLLGFQSRTGPVRWIGPGTDELLDRLGEEGVREVLVVPLSFVTDHIETLYELDILFADRARRAGITDYRRTRPLGTHPLFIEALGRLVERHLEEHP